MASLQSAAEPGLTAQEASDKAAANAALLHRIAAAKQQRSSWASAPASPAGSSPTALPAADTSKTPVSGGPELVAKLEQQVLRLPKRCLVE